MRVGLLLPLLHTKEEEERSRADRRSGSRMSQGSCRASVLFGTLGVVLEEQSEGEDAEQKALDKPQATSGHAGDAFVAAKGHTGETRVKPAAASPRFLNPTAVTLHPLP